MRPDLPHADAQIMRDLLVGRPRDAFRAGFHAQVGVDHPGSRRERGEDGAEDPGEGREHAALRAESRDIRKRPFRDARGLGRH